MSSWHDLREDRTEFEEGWESRRVVSIEKKEKPRDSYPWFKPTDALGKKLRRGERVMVSIGGKDMSGRLKGSYPNGDCWVEIKHGDVRLVPKSLLRRFKV